MNSYELCLVEKQTNRLITRTPNTTAPLGSFNRGDGVELDGRWIIDGLYHQVIIDADVSLCRTILVVVPFAAEGLATNYPWPDLS